MKYCTHCGNELLDEAVICMKCGCAAGAQKAQSAYLFADNNSALLDTLSQRIKINGIIWLVIGILQIAGGIFINWILLIPGVLNIISSVNDINYSKTLLEDPTGIIKRFEPLTGPIITLVYNLIIGGVIGVIGSIYYFIAIRSFVMENKSSFA